MRVAPGLAHHLGLLFVNQARPARPLLKLRKLRFHGELAWGEPIK